jgi:hypothetical protein
MPVIPATGGAVVPPDGVRRNIVKAGAPSANEFAGQVALGGLLTDVTNAKLYICTATNGSSTATWTVVGAQT